MNPSNIGIVVTSYAPQGEVGESRIQAYRESLETWKKNLVYDGNFFIVLEDDGSPDENFQKFIEISLAYDAVLSKQAHRQGVGASLNRGFQAAFKNTSQALYLVDDWALDARFDITPWVELLERDDSLGMIRFGPPHPWLSGVIEHHDGLWITRLERHHYAYGMRPAIYHKRFFDVYGEFPEKCSAMECERIFNEFFCQSSGPDIALALPHPWRIVENAELGYLNPVTEKDS